jgi:hypothetical protein
MARTFHRILTIALLTGLLKASLDLGLHLMNQPYDFTFFLGLMLNIIAAFAYGFFVGRVISSKFNSIKDLFTHK